MRGFRNTHGPSTAGGISVWRMGFFVKLDAGQFFFP
jgi:hypothetical protein